MQWHSKWSYNGKTSAIKEKWTYKYDKYITKKNEEYYVDMIRKPYMDIHETYPDEKTAKNN